MRSMTLAFAAALALAPHAFAAAPPTRAAQAVQRGLRRLEQGAARYTANRQCFSCHHQAATLAAFTAARARGFRVPEQAHRAQVEFTLDTFRGKQAQLRKGAGVP